LKPDKESILVIGHTLRGDQSFFDAVERNHEKVRIAHVGGAGNKCLHLACGNIDTYMSGYLDFWDLCAGDVICRA